jgi:hypothetical protein
LQARPWTTNGSPYILSADCTVVSNQTLTIQPGVTVIIGPGASLFVYGGIDAVGTPEAPIFFRGPTPTDHWNQVVLGYSGFIDRFHYGFPPLRPADAIVTLPNGTF